MQTQVAWHRKFHRLARQIAGNMLIRHITIAFDQPFFGENVGNPHDIIRLAFTNGGGFDSLVFEQRGIE